MTFTIESKIKAVKLLRSALSLGLKESKELVYEIADTLAPEPKPGTVPPTVRKVAVCIRDLPTFHGGGFIAAGTDHEIDAFGLIEGGYRPESHPHFFRIEGRAWKPTHGQEFWFITENWELAPRQFDMEYEYHVELVKLGNCYPTREMAESRLVAVRAALRGEA